MVLTGCSPATLQCDHEPEYPEGFQGVHNDHFQCSEPGRAESELREAGKEKGKRHR